MKKPPVICHECGAWASRVTGEVIYPHRPDLHRKNFWRCNCGAYVGCHPGTGTPLGSPCGPVTRAARSRAHAAFDPLWKAKIVRDGVAKHEARGAAYRWLATSLNIEPERCHIGMMDAVTADRVTALCGKYRKVAA